MESTSEVKEPGLLNKLVSSSGSKKNYRGRAVSLSERFQGMLPTGKKSTTNNNNNNSSNNTEVATLIFLSKDLEKSKEFSSMDVSPKTNDVESTSKQESSMELFSNKESEQPSIESVEKLYRDLNQILSEVNDCQNTDLESTNNTNFKEEKNSETTFESSPNVTKERKKVTFNDTQDMILLKNEKTTKTNLELSSKTTSLDEMSEETRIENIQERILMMYETLQQYENKITYDNLKLIGEEEFHLKILKTIENIRDELDNQKSLKDASPTATLKKLVDINEDINKLESNYIIPIEKCKLELNLEIQKIISKIKETISNLKERLDNHKMEVENKLKKNNQTQILYTSFAIKIDFLSDSILDCEESIKIISEKTDGEKILSELDKLKVEIEEEEEKLKK